MKYIPLTKGYIAIVDDVDYQQVQGLRWHADVRPHTVYASTSMVVNGKRREVRLHSFLTGLPRVDHRNNNGLDNQRRNLRAATQQQNVWNSVGIRKSGPLKGVTFLKRLRTNPWQARIAHDGKQFHLGYFATATEAALAYDVAAQELRKNFAHVNGV